MPFKTPTHQSLLNAYNPGTYGWDPIETDGAGAAYVAFKTTPTVDIGNIPGVPVIGPVRTNITDEFTDYPARVLFADNDADDTGASYPGLLTNGRQYAWNATDAFWERVQAGIANGDLLDDGTRQGLFANARLHGWQTDNSTWFRLRSSGVNSLLVTMIANDGTDLWVLAAPGDDLPNPNAMATIGFNYLYDAGSNDWDRWRGSATYGALVDVTRSVLPTGAATEVTLSAISGQLPATLGQTVMAGSLSVAIASDQTPIPVSATIPGTVTADQGMATPLAGAWPVELTDGTNTPGYANSTPIIGTWGLVTYLGGGASDFGTAFPSSGFAAGYLAADASMRSARVFDTDSGAGQEFTLGVNLRLTANGGSVETGTAANPLRVDPTGTTAQPITDNAGSITVDSPQFPATLGQKVMAASMAVVIASDQSVIPVNDNGGSLTTDTPQLPGALVGGRLDTNNGAWMGSTAPTVGQKTMASSIPVVVASNQTAVNVGSIAGAITPGTGASNLGKAEDAAHASGDVGVMALGVVNTGHTARAANGDYIPIATDLEGDVNVTSGVAHDAADADNPIKIGGQARNTNTTKVANSDRVNAIFDTNGRLIVEPYGPRELDTKNNITLASTTETTLLAAGGAGVYHDLIGLLVTNTSDSSVRCDFRDATAGTIRFSVWIANANSYSSVYMPFQRPVRQTTANNNWTAQLSMVVTDVRLMVQAVKRN